MIYLIIVLALITLSEVMFLFLSKTFTHRCKNGLIIISNFKCPDCGKDWNTMNGEEQNG